MDLSELLKKDLIEKFQSSKTQIETEIENAEKRLRSAERILKIKEWGDAHSAAYNSMLHAGRALMFSKGYRPKGSDHHVAVVSFSKIYAKRYPSNTLEAFDRGRKHRNEFQYDDADSISESQAINMVDNSKKFVSCTKDILRK